MSWFEGSTMYSPGRDRKGEAEAATRANPLELAELTERLRWFMTLRWLMAASIVAITAALQWLGGIDLPVVPLFAIAGIVALYDLAFWLHLRHVEGRRAPSAAPAQGIDPRYVARVANLQISLDLVLLSALLYFVGLVENPFYLYYVFHVMIASMLLTRRATYLQAALALLLFSTLAILEYFGTIPHVTVAALGLSPAYQRPAYVLAVLAALGTTLLLAAYMGTSISGRLRHREREVILLKEELEEAYAHLQQTERAKTQYLLKVSHQLRAPLAAIQSLITVVLKGLTGPIGDQTTEVLERASTRLKEMLDVVTDLLALARAREPRMERTRQPVALGDVARRVADLYRAEAVARGLSLQVSIPEQLPPLLGDPEGIEDVIANLISNAIKYTPQGGRVELTVTAGPEMAEIRVSDTGIGIPEEEIPRIFEEFHRAKQAREMVKEGTGLGLPIVKAIVDAHGGSIEVHSKPGRRTTFTVKLPLSPTTTASEGTEP